MVGDPGSCYRENPQTGGGLNCPGQMFGDNAPAATWQMTFTHAALGPALAFPTVPGDSIFMAEGSGVNSPKPPKQPGGGGGGNGGPGGGPVHGGPPKLPLPIPTPPPILPFLLER
jgi:hypothetical protein